MSSSFRVVGFGDFLLRLSPPGHLRFAQATSFNRYYTGAEANVCASLAVMGCDAAFVTRVPDSPIGRAALNELRKLGVDVSRAVFGGDRLGVLYLEKGASQRPSVCIYDRMNSGVTTARPEHFDWAEILRGARYFHITGITPGLGGALPQIAQEACRTAHVAGAEVVCDLNYRSKLWSVGEAAKVLPDLVEHADHLIANAWDARNLLGVETGDDPDEACRRLRTRFPRLKTIAMTFRTATSASENTLTGLVNVDDVACRSRAHTMHLVDRVGGGDAFAAGLIYGLGNGMTPQETVDFATAASCLKHAIELDVNLATVPEIMQLVNGNGSGRVQR